MKIRTTWSVVIRVFIWIVMLLGGVIGGLWLDINNHKDLLYNPYFHIITFLIGIILMVLAFRAAATGGRELAKYGKIGNVPRLETNKLVTTGIYAKMRHPMLFGLALVPLALALIVGSPSFITIIAPLEMVFIIVMVLTFEEYECKKKFKEAYKKYSQEVPAVCFSFDCLKMLFFQKSKL